METPVDFRELVEAWELSLRARGKSPNTIRSYLETAHQFVGYLEDHGIPLDAREVTGRHVEAYILHVLETRSPSTARLRFRSLQQLFRYLTDEGDVEQSPMDKLKAPPPDEKVVPVVPADDLRQLLKAFEGRTFTDRRDLAIVMFLLDTGARLSETVGLTIDDIDFDAGVVYVVGKGRRERALPLSPKVAERLKRYEMTRRRHSAAASPAFWLGARGPLGASGLTQMLRRRCDLAGIPRIHPHQFRHTFAHEFLASGGNEGDLMLLAGWKSRQMVARYGSSVAAERARDAHRAHSPIERLLG